MAKDLQVCLLLDYYGAMLTEKQHTLVDLYYNQDFSLSEIAESEGMTRQGARDGIKRAESALYDLEAKLGIINRAEITAALTAKIRAAADKISVLTGDAEIAKQIKTIKSTAKKIEN